MPINQIALANDIETAFNDESDKNVDPAAARKRQAVAIAAAIVKQLLAADVISVVAGASATGKIQ
jgi:hypothetical protein